MQEKNEKDRRLSLSEARYRAVVESIGMGIIIISSDLHIVTYNDQAATWFPDIRKGVRYETFFDKYDESGGATRLLREALFEGIRGEMELRVGGDEENFRIYRIVITPLQTDTGVAAAVKVVDDITEKSRQEAAMARAMQMAVVGQLAAGIAHEFNNINSVVKGHVQLILKQRERLPDDVASQLDKVLQMIERGVSITGNMLMFARNRKAEKTAVYVAKIVDDVVELVRNDVKSDDVELIVENEPNLRMYVNDSQIGQVLLNLIINARHALIGREQKRIVIRSFSSGEKACISVTDTGCGIPKRHMKRLFNPFFSTKGEHADPGSPLAGVRGSGLGLAVCHNIISKHHNGRVLVDSVEDVGTTFTIEIDRFHGPVRIDPKKNESSLICLTPAHGERVLVLDDDNDVAALIKTVFSSQGYEVVVLSDGIEGIKILQKERFDVVIADIKMPKMGGLEVMAFIDGVGGEKPVRVLMTGSSFGQPIEESLRADALFKKPFDFESMLRVVQLGLMARRERRERL